MDRGPFRWRPVLALGLAALALAAVAITLTSPTGRRASPRSPLAPPRAPSTSTAARAPRAAQPLPHTAPTSFAVGLQVLRLVDRQRTIRLPDGMTEPRVLVTYVRYPALAARKETDLPDAAPARADGPFPLIVFGHGFTVTPRIYAHLLQSWARAGYIVAAPVFPLENANAPGGPNESDLINQPADMSLVISRLLAASSSGKGPLAGLVDRRRLAVSGQSDGGETALAVAYDRSFRDARVGAAVILSGAKIPGHSGFSFPAGSPPLLATQGTADTINPPSFTNAFFDSAPRPKYLLSLLGAGHLPPYTDQQPQLGVVERVTTAFFDHYLGRKRRSLQRLSAFGNVPGTAALHAEP